MDNNSKTNIGVFLILQKKDKLFFLQRKDTLLYSFPAGKVEHNETIQKAAIRELCEEVGIIISEKDLLLQHKMNFQDKNNHITHIGYFFKVLDFQGQIKILEPEKHLSYKWIKSSSLSNEEITKHCAFAIHNIEKNITESNFKYNKSFDDE